MKRKAERVVVFTSYLTNNSEGKTMDVRLVPVSRYHQRIIATAIHSAKPNTNDRDRMDDWVTIASKIGEAIRGQGGHFDMDTWMDICYYGPR